MTKIRYGKMFLADLGAANRAEPGKVRPVVIVQTDMLNSQRLSTTVVVPCTSLLQSSNILRARLAIGAAGNPKECDVMLDQIRSIDNRRFLREVGTVHPSIMNEIRYKLARILEIEIAL